MNVRLLTVDITSRLGRSGVSAPGSVLRVFPESHTLATGSGNAGEGCCMLWARWSRSSSCGASRSSGCSSRWPVSARSTWAGGASLSRWACLRFSTTPMGKELPSVFFDELGTVFSVAVTLLWILVAAGTVRKLVTGQVLFAPCLKDLEGVKQAHTAKHFWGWVILGYFASPRLGLVYLSCQC